MPRQKLTLGGSVLMPSRPRASSSTRVHPLALAQMLDHFLRLRLNATAMGKESEGRDAGGVTDSETNIDLMDEDASTEACAIGALFGVENGDGGSVRDVLCAVELVGRRDRATGTVTIEDEHGKLALARARRTRSECSIVGFYRASMNDGSVEDGDLEMFDLLAAKVRDWERETGDQGDGVANDASALVKCGAGGDASEPPKMKWYERTSDGFVEREFSMETGESERIVVDALANISLEEEDASHSATSVKSLESAAEATRALRDRLRTTLGYLSAVRNGDAAIDFDVLRSLVSVMNDLRASSSDSVRDTFVDEYEDVLLVNYLASLTKAVDNLNELVDKYHFAHGDHGGVQHAERGGERSGRFHARDREARAQERAMLSLF